SKASPTPATLPLPNPVRRSLAQRLWPIWVAAAALLLAIFSGVESHRRGTADREQAVADAKKQQQTLDERFAELKLRGHAEEQAIWNLAKRNTLRLPLVGPAQISAHAPSVYRAAVRDLDGQAVDANKLDVRLVRAD